MSLTMTVTLVSLIINPAQGVADLRFAARPQALMSEAALLKSEVIIRLVNLPVYVFRGLG